MDLLRKQKTERSGQSQRRREPGQQPASVTRGRPSGFHSSMPRSNPHARERVMDDEKHLDALARSFPSRGAKRRSCLRLVRGAGALSKLPRTQSVTKRCSRRRRVGAPPHPPFGARRGILDSGLSARADERSRSQERGTRPARKSGQARRWHGSLSRPRRRSARNVEEREPERRETNPSFSRRRKSSRPAASHRHGTDRAPARPAGAARNRPFEWVVLTIVSSWQKSDERRRRRGRAQHRETGAACRSETQRGETLAARVSPVRWKALWIISTCRDRHGSSWAGDLGPALADASHHR